MVTRNTSPEPLSSPRPLPVALCFLPASRHATSIPRKLATVMLYPSGWGQATTDQKLWDLQPEYALLPSHLVRYLLTVVARKLTEWTRWTGQQQMAIMSGLSSTSWHWTPKVRNGCSLMARSQGLQPTKHPRTLKITPSCRLRIGTGHFFCLTLRKWLNTLLEKPCTGIPL